jgi:hypothetical protein
MAHKNFAQLNENNLVINVLKCDDTETVDSLLKKGLNCVEATSGVQKGDTWQSENNRFINAQPYDNWTLNNETGKWEAPVAEPTSIYVDSNNNSIELKPWFLDWNDSLQRWECFTANINSTETEKNSSKLYWNPDNSTWNII